MCINIGVQKRACKTDNDTNAVYNYVSIDT